jgi:hypothetical protein
MNYVFMDESGDLGFDFTGRKTSKYFVITCLFVENKNPVEKVVNKTIKAFSKKELKNFTGMHHSYKESPKIRMKLLSLLLDKDISVVVIYLNKSKVYTNLADEKHVLYN